MKRVTKKLFRSSILLFSVGLIVMLLIPCNFTTVEAISNDEITSKISSLQGTMDGYYWNAGKSESELISAINRGDYSFGLTGSACSLSSANDASHHLTQYGCTSNTFNGSRQCAGFAEYMGYAIFGSKVSTSNGWTKYTSSSGITLEPGDIIRYSGHSAMVWYTSGDTLYVAEANWWDNQKRWCQVHFGKSWSSVSQVKSNLTYIWKHPANVTPSTPTSPPTGAWIWSDKTVAAVGEEIAFNYNATGAVNFFVGVNKEGVGRVRTVDVGTSDWYRTSFSEPGTYTIYASCYNSAGYMDSNSITFTIYDSTPKDAWITVDKTIANSGTELTFTYNATNAVGFWIGLIKDGERIDTFQNLETSFKRTFNDSGTYSIYITAYNTYGGIDSKAITFTIYNSKPTEAKLKVSSERIEVNEPLKLFYSAKNTEKYVIGYYPTNDSSNIIAINKGKETEGEIKFSTPGEYCVHVQCINYYGHMDTEYINILVYDSQTEPTPTPTVKPTVTLTPTETPYDGLAVTAKKVTAKAGSEVEIPISISKNPGIAGFKFKISYDKSVLIPISITKGSAFGNGTLNSNINQGGDLSNLDEVTAYWSNPSNVSADGEMFTVKFKVSDNATDGTYPITLTYEDGDITNQTFDNINPKIINGAVTLTKVKKGDIYEDGVVNTKDGVLLSQYLAKWNINFTENQMTAADVYEDGVVNTKDGVKLSQVLAKWDNVTLSSEISASADGIAVSIPNIDTNAGEYIDVPVTLSKNSGIAGFNFNINYDTSTLTPVSITAGDILSDGTFTSNLLQDINLSHLECVTAYWNNPSNITDNGTLFTIRFKVNENASGILPITVTYNDGDICNQEFENVNADITNGAINVSASVAGKYYEIASAKMTNVAGEEVDTIPQNGNFTVNATINELAKYSGNAKLYCVLYDDNDLLVSITNADISDKTNYEFAIPNINKNIAKIKLFAWNTFSGMKPLSDCVAIE